VTTENLTQRTLTTDTAEIRISVYHKAQPIKAIDKAIEVDSSVSAKPATPIETDLQGSANNLRAIAHES
jgi:hypothetical protein